MIQTITKYKFQGKEYNSLKEIQDIIHNIIGEEVIDKIDIVCPFQKYKNIDKVLEILCSPEVRKILTECYNVTFDEDTSDECFNEPSKINILDLKF